MKIPIILFMLLCSTLSHATTFKIATLAPDGSDWMQRMKSGAKEIAKQTDNRVKFKFYPGGVMGDDKAVLRKMRIGQLHGAAMPSGSLARFYTDSQVYNLVLKFRSFEEVDYVRQKMDPLIMEGFEKGGLITFGLSEGGFAYTMSQKRVSAYKDLKQLKVWVPDSDPLGLEIMRAFGINPIPLSIGDVLTGLQTGLINTIASSPVGAIALQWHNQVNFITDLPLLYIYATLAIDSKAFKRASPQDQKIMREVLIRTFDGIDKQNRKDNLAAFAALKNQNIKLIMPSEEELAAWRIRAEESTQRLIKKGIVSKEIVALIDQHLANYRNQMASN